MTTTLAPPVPPAARLRLATAGVRLSISWLGLRRSLSRAQQSEAAETFAAAGDYVAATKKLLDTRHPAFQQVTAVRGRAIALWKGMSLPFPEPGIRLLKQDDVPEFDARMTALADELAAAVAALEPHYDELRAVACARLGRLYDPRDYPPALADEFQLRWDYPTVEPPPYLARLHPEVYERERRRVAEQFDAAVRLAEQAFCSELGGLVSRLAERLRAPVDGKPKVFRDSAVENVREFCARFRRLAIGGHDELDELVADAERLVAGIEPHALRTSASLRGEVAGELARVAAGLDELLVDRPRRQILRRAK
ncbi:MAG: hypothetical protein KF847_19360 [Pirellulales bacterium]|nr:hypothetical protein [Pirellulales bacterium]